jgi:hypothetical protein
VKRRGTTDRDLSRGNGWDSPLGCADHIPVVPSAPKVTVDQTEQLSALISDIDDAALDSSLWTGALGKAGGFVGGVCAALFCRDSASKSGNLYYDSGGIDEGFRQLLLDKYVQFDPAMTGHFWARLEQPVATADLMPYDKFLATRFYEEWVRPQGLVDFVESTGR